MFDNYFENKIKRVSYRKGVFIIPKLLTNYGIENICAELDTLIDKLPAEWLDNNCTRDEDGRIIVLKSIDTPSDFFFKLARHPIFFKLSEQFGRKKTTPLYVEIFDKPPFCKHGSPPHQDQAFYESHFNDELGITFWISLDYSTIESGCLHFSSATNRVLLNHVASKSCGFTYELSEEYSLKYKPVELNPGGCIIHGAYTPHFSSINSTPNHRRALAISFRTSEFLQQNNK